MKPNLDNIAVGDGVTILLYSDSHAHTVIKVTKKTILMQRDIVKLLNGFDSGEPDALKFSPGGFAGNARGVQRYEYTRNEDGHIVKATLRKDGSIRVANSKAKVLLGRYEHYDFNF